jgi:hypothetical protein
VTIPSPVLVWRNLRRAVREAHALGVEFRIRGAEVDITGVEQLPARLRDALDPVLLYDYLGGATDDDEATAFLARLGVEAILVTTAQDAELAELELMAQGAVRVGLDIVSGAI